MVRKVLFSALFVFLLGCFALPALSLTEPLSTAPTGFGVSVSVDQFTYVRPVIKMSLKIFNNTAGEITFNFRTSQRYDFTLYNSQGVKVWRWSDGQGFLQVLGSLTLKPTQIVEYTAEFQALQMPEDLYTLKGELTAYDPQLMKPRVMEGTVSFWRVFVQ